MPLPLSYLLTAVVAYVLGAVPFGYIVARSHKNVDILRHGSGRTGTTNVLRTLGWKAAGIVFFGDFGKGVVAVLLARLITGGDPVAEAMAGFVTILGHTYSAFIGFKGGRGVAAGVGALFAMSPIAGLVAAIVAFSAMGLTRYASLGSILGALSAPVTTAFLVVSYGDSPARFAYALVGSLFVVVTHKDNIGRLLAGKERKLGERVQV